MYSFFIGGDGRVYKGCGWDCVGFYILYYDYVLLVVFFMGNFNNIMLVLVVLVVVDKFLMCGV